MSQPCAFVDPSSLTLPSRLPSPASSTDHPSPDPTDEPPRKRPRSAVTPEERKEARAHRNRIAAQNSRDRRKAQFVYLERRVAELEDENRRLRAGILTPSISALPEPGTMSIDREQEQRKREEEQRERERENQELRERIRTLEKGYEVVVRALAAQGNFSVASSIPTPPATSPVSSLPSQSPSQPTLDSGPSDSVSPSSLDLSSASLLPLSPSSSNSTLVDTPLLFASGDSFDLPPTPALSPTDTSRTLSKDTGGEHCRPFGSVPAAGGQHSVGNGTGEGNEVLVSDAPEHEDEAASDAVIKRLLAEILASPPLGSSALPSSSPSSEEAVSQEVLTTTEINPSNSGLGLGPGASGIDPVDWIEQVHAEMEMEKLLGMLPNVQDVAVEEVLNSSANLDVDMDLSSALTWDGISVV